MSKFAGNKGFINPTSNQQRALTHEGGLGYVRNARSELFLQAVAEMAEDTFYESAEDRQARVAANIRSVIAEKGGWEWICNLVSWLRNEGQMRSASVMVAAEAVAAKPAEASVSPSARQLIDSACVRADEPAEVLGYWLTNHGRQIPAPVKRGIADAAVRLYTERNALKYDGQSRGVRMGDVIELTHPKPKSASIQSDLFRHLIDRRHNRDEMVIPASLGLMQTDAELQAVPVDSRRSLLGSAVNAGWSWERLAGWLPGGMDAEAWEAIIPQMGYMALLRNLRNFDQAGISPATIKYIQDKLADPEQVSKSRQFPYRFLSAFQQVESLNWGYALEQALSLSVQNVPEFSGRTLVLVDTSGSMQSSVGGQRSVAQRCDVAALFGTVLAQRNLGQVDLAIYASGVAPWPIAPGQSILRNVKAMHNAVGSVGHGTNTWEAIRSQYKGHDRIVVLTDEQSHDSGTNPGCYMHFINLAGYRVATAPQDRRTFAYGGFTDAMFRLLPVMEASHSNQWPWE